MKNFLIGFVLVVLMASVGFAQLGQGTTTYNPSSQSPYYNGMGCLGDPTHYWDRLYVNYIDYNAVVHETWTSPAAADTDVIKCVYISTTTLSKGASTWAETYMAVFTPPRNIGVSFDGYQADVIKSTDWIRGTVDLTGYDAKGNAITETVVSTFSTVNYSNNAFSRITGAVWTVTAISNKAQLEASTADTPIRCNMGMGVKLGLSKPLTATTDVIAVNENNVGIRYGSIAALMDATYDTYDPSTDPAGTCREIWYKSEGTQ